MQDNETPKKTLQERCKTLLGIWNANEDGSGQYKFTGGYWEVLYPLLKKYAPEELKRYQNLLSEEFNYFDERVKAKVDTGDEEQNFRNAVNYMNNRIRNMYAAGSEHQIDLGDDEIIAYLPNQNIDQNDYWGREDNSDLFNT